MKRTTKCIVQTINLSNPKTCIKPKVQKLVSADEDSYVESDRDSKSWAYRPMTVKICSRKDAQRKCPPKLCDCPQESLPLTKSKKLGRTMLFLIKGIFVGGLIYWTRSEGLWGDSSKTEDLYYRIISTFAPDQSEQLPHLEEIKYSVLEAYNHMLVKCMDIIVRMPGEIHQKITDILFPCETNDTKVISGFHSKGDSKT